MILKIKPPTFIHILKFCGNYSRFENAVAEATEDAKQWRAIITLFNYRGVGQSTQGPTKFLDLVSDGVAQVKNLLDRGVRPENIILHGYSMGGAVATKVAEHFLHKEKMTLTLINDRSFSSLSAAAEGILRAQFEGVVRQIPTFVRVFGISLALQWYGWEVNVAESFLKHPHDRKLLLAVFPENWSGGKFGDGVIIADASLAKKVESAGAWKDSPCFLLDSEGSPNAIGHVLSLNQLFNKDSRKQSGKEIVGNFINDTLASLRR